LTDDPASMAADAASTDAVASSAAFEETAGTASAVTVVPEAALTGSMAAVDSMEVAVATEAGTGKISKSDI
jgi:hypothetical protein